MRQFKNIELGTISAETDHGQITTIQVSLDDGTIYEIEPSRHKHCLKIRLVDTRSMDMQLAIFPEASNTVLLCPASPDADNGEEDEEDNSDDPCADDDSDDDDDI